MIEGEGESERIIIDDDDAPEGSGTGMGNATGHEEERSRGSMEAVPSSQASSSGSGTSSGAMASSKREVGTDRPKMTQEGVAAGPKKMKVVIRDAAWSTWWAVLFWVSSLTINYVDKGSSL